MRFMRPIAYTAGFMLVLVLLALSPILFEARDGRLALNLPLAFRSVGLWFGGLADGRSWTFTSGVTTWNFAAVVPKFAAVTLAYLVIPGVLGLAGGFALGLSRDPRSRLPRHGLVDSALNAAFALPDFILAVLVQLFVIAVLDATGHKLFTISYDPRRSVLLVLPLVVMTVYPFIHSYRSAMRAAAQAAQASFVVNAEARGISRASLRYKHIGVAVLASLGTDLPSILAMMMTSIFIVEYSFSLPGMTRWLFTVAFSGSRRGWYDSYQFPLALNILMCMAAAYFLAMLGLRLALAGMKAVVVRAL